MKEIQLTQGKVALVDDEDYERLRTFRWHAVAPRGKERTWYAARYVPVVEQRARQCGPRLFMHYCLLTVPAGMLIDHRDRNGLNNQKSNLRCATKEQNAANRCFEKNRTKYRGVSRKGKKWAAFIMVNHRKKCLGVFLTAPFAALAYDRAARQMLGEFARLNFPGPGEFSTRREPELA